MLKKTLCLLLSLALALTLAFPVFADTETPEDEITAEVPPVRLTISTLADFLSFAELCRLDAYSQNLHVELAADIDLNGCSFQGIPVFCGSFNGNGHTVSGLSILAKGSVIGLFRYLTDSAHVYDLSVQGTLYPQGSKSTVGGIVGSNAGKIENCAFSGSIIGGDYVGGIAGSNTVTGILDSCTASGDISGNHFIGGIAGNNLGVIRNCENAALVNTTAQQNNVDISDITMQTLTGSESANTVTDAGGIAGNSSGVIHNCVNFADVGYPHMGYNIGGIAGSQIGYIVDCQNFGAICGRKEVGGIAGQMEPVTNIEFTTDTLQILQGQLNTLGGLANQASAHAQSSANTITSQIAALQDQTENARDAIENLFPTEEDPTLPDMDSLQAAQNTLNSSLTSMQGSFSSIAATAQSLSGTLVKDMQAISGQIGAMSQTINDAPENLGGTVSDISDQDTQEDLTGKVADCQNYGPVSADLNVGGITGAVSPENDLDTENDLEITGQDSLNFDAELRAVITQCTNTAEISAGKQNAGGIAGWMSMGLVKASVNTGSVTAESADYVGGIVGQSTGFVRSCYAKCRIQGDAFVGGIAGIAEILSDSRSMVLLTGTERVGAILGMANSREEIVGNYYLPVSADPGAIDGVSYASTAAPLQKEDFLALESLPDFFRTNHFRFLFPDGSSQTVTIPVGEMLTQDQIPAIEEKKSNLSYWEGLDSSTPAFDSEFTAVYVPTSSVIQSETTTAAGMPLLLAEGTFPVDATVEYAPSAAAPALEKNQSFLQGFSYTVSESATPVTFHCRLPDSYDGTPIQLLMQQADGTWEIIPCTIDDSYVVFTADTTQGQLALVQTQPFPWLMAGLAAGAVLLIALVAIALGKQRKAKKSPPTHQ